MTDPFVPDVLPKILTELRDDQAVAAIVGQRVRGAEPAPGDAAFDDIEGGKRKYEHSFIVVSRLAAPRHRQLPVQFATFAIRCYGTDRRRAAELRWAASNALHRKGPRVDGGLGIYQSLEDAGGEQERDPDTGQPLETFIVSAIATTQVVTA